MDCSTKPRRRQKGTPNGVYQPRSIKRTRRTKAAIERIDDALVEICEQRKPTTIRHVFYVAANNYGIVSKTEKDYKNVVCHRLKVLRRSGRIPWGWLTDNTRWHIKNRSYASLDDALDEMQDSYRRNLWLSQRDYVEVWCEKDAIAGILTRATEQFDVPLMVVRGFSSLSFLYDMAERMVEIDKPTYIYYFGDHDPSGLSISKCIERELRRFAPNVELHFQRVAVIPAQIVQWSLPTRPTKQSDSRARNFVGDSVEVDAIDPRKLVELASAAIEVHVDSGALAKTKMIEQAERATLAGIMERLNGGRDDA